MCKQAKCVLPYRQLTYTNRWSCGTVIAALEGSMIKTPGRMTLRNKYYLRFLPAALLCLWFGTTSRAITIDFDSGPNGIAVGRDYVSTGVVFDQGFYASSPYPSGNGSPGWISGEPVTAYNGIGNAPITGRFLFPVSHVSAELMFLEEGDVPHLTGYDKKDQIVASSDWFTLTIDADGNQIRTISISNPNIVNFAFTFTWDPTRRPNSPIDDVIGIDNLTFEPDPPHGNGNHVPDAGSTLLLLGIALGGLDFMRRR